jgi:hypothetical protein
MRRPSGEAAGLADYDILFAHIVLKSRPAAYTAF